MVSIKPKNVKLFCFSINQDRILEVLLSFTEIFDFVQNGFMVCHGYTLITLIYNSESPAFYEKAGAEDRTCLTPLARGVNPERYGTGCRERPLRFASSKTCGFKSLKKIFQNKKNAEDRTCPSPLLSEWHSATYGKGYRNR